MRLLCTRLKCFYTRFIQQTPEVNLCKMLSDKRFPFCTSTRLAKTFDQCKVKELATRCTVTNIIYWCQFQLVRVRKVSNYPVPNNLCSDSRLFNLTERELSRCVIKQKICICETKEADQLCSHCTADQRHCFCYSDSTVPHLPISKISSF